MELDFGVDLPVLILFWSCLITVEGCRGDWSELVSLFCFFKIFDSVKILFLDNRGRDSFHSLLIFLVATTTRSENSQSQEPGTQAWCLMWLTDAQLFGPSSASVSGASAGSWRRSVGKNGLWRIWIISCTYERGRGTVHLTWWLRHHIKVPRYYLSWECLLSGSASAVAHVFQNWVGRMFGCKSTGDSTWAHLGMSVWHHLQESSFHLLFSWPLRTKGILQQNYLTRVDFSFNLGTRNRIPRSRGRLEKPRTF